MTVETATRPAVAEPTTPIRPSEALRLGRLLYPRRIEGDFDDGKGGRCAIGAIHAGYGVGTPGEAIAVDALIGEAGDRSGGCPFGCPNPNMHVVAHLNDRHHWNDDQIVAWLESLGL